MSLYDQVKTQYISDMEQSITANKNVPYGNIENVETHKGIVKAQEACLGHFKALCTRFENGGQDAAPFSEEPEIEIIPPQS